MGGLRILGLCLGIIGVLFTFLYYRGIRWRRNNFILLFLFNVNLITISLWPGSINLLRDMLALKSSVWGRILALLITSVIFLFLAVFYLKSKLDFHVYLVDRLVREFSKFQAYSKENQMLMKPLMIVVPSFNEAENLRELIPKVPSEVDGIEVGLLVVDDGSTDNTEEVCQSLNCLVVKSVIGRGQGAALRLGYDIILKHGTEICVTLDADNQHDVNDIPRLVRPILEDKADIVIGSRTLGENKNTGGFRNSGLKIFNKIISSLLHQKISDCSSGFRAINTKVFGNIDLREVQYQSSELIIEAVKKGYRIKEEPITIHQRKHGKTKKGTNFKYGLNFAKVILKTWWR